MRVTLNGNSRSPDCVCAIRGIPGFAMRSTRATKSLHPGRKQLVRRYYSRGETLLVHVASDRLVSGPVRLQAVGPEVVPDDAPGFLDMIEKPGQGKAQGVGIVETLDGKIARFAQRLVEAPCRPGMRAVDVLA